jgi:general secretion pathway protein G
MKPIRQHQHAFTLLEIMLVVMIIALLAGAAIYAMRGQVDGARIQTAEMDVQNLTTALQQYDVRNGIPPTTNQGLKALVEKPSGEPAPRRWFKQMEKVPIDPWGMEYRYEYPGRRNNAGEKGFDIYSAGPDRQPGTADDIGNWSN